MSFNQYQLNAAPNQSKIQIDQNDRETDFLIPAALPLSETSKRNCELNCPFNEVCDLNELTNRFECICPASLNYFRINNKCREYLSDMVTCRLFDKRTECPLNEECVTTENYSKEGTCQCLSGYRRDKNTYDCKKQYSDILNFHNSVSSNSLLYGKMKERRRPHTLETPPKIYNDEQLALERRRPATQEPSKTLDYENDQQLFDKILSSLKGLTNNKEENSEDYSKLQIRPDIAKENTLLELSKNPISSTEPMTIATTSTTTTSTTTPLANTDAPKIMTENLIANAGADIHVYYPSKVCILNGTSSKVLNINNSNMKIQWTWSKLESSPAFGKFSSSNENPIVFYENLVEGVYRFVLKITTNEYDQSKQAWVDHFSQDTVDVFVHSSYISKQHELTDNSAADNFKSHADLQVVYENLIQIELDYKPEQFTQLIENQFIQRLEILLKQSDFKFNNPKVILTNTRISSGSKSSRVVLEFFVCEDPNVNSRKENIFDFKKYAKLEEDLGHGFLLNSEMEIFEQNIIDSVKIVQLLKRKSLSELIDSTLSYVNKLPEKQAKMIQNIIKPSNMKKSRPGYSELKIIDVSLLTCEIGNFSVVKQCSSHGECDHFTGKCVCNKYWMPNLYLYYLRNEQDMTSGNNCEWNIILVVLSSLAITAGSFIALKYMLKYFFYYLFCCCLCCRRNSKNLLKQKLRSRKDKFRYYSQKDRRTNYVDDDDDNSYEDDSNLKLLDRSDSSDNMQNKASEKKSSFKQFLTKSFKSVPTKQNHKYALLDDHDDMELNNKKKGDATNMIGNRYDQRMGSELATEYTDEEIVFDKKKSPPPKIKEYKNLV